VVGATANNLQDVHESPWRGELMPGPEVQANAINTVRNAWPLRSLPRALELLIIVVMVLIPVALNRRLKPIAAFLVALLIAAAYIGASVPVFSAGKILPIIYPVLGITVTSIGYLGLAYITTAFDRQRTKDTFARFVPEAVVGQLLARSGGGLVKLSSEEVEATVLFSDIRGFTTFSETRTPEQVIAILNRYLTGMTDAILDNGGTLVSYIGDGIMAVFGAPIHQHDHADRAVRAAKEMLGPKLEEFNRYAISELGLDYGFAMGVGLNTGPVMSGMVGSQRRLDYTTIGDTVNTASRLEGATKDIDGSLLVAESTRARVTVAADELEYLGEIEIRGREQGLGAWTIPGL
jgi:adenylate cyclase